MKPHNTIGIVNYGAGNLFSLSAALEKQEIDYGMVNSNEDLNNFDRIIIPGVGHASAAMSKLSKTGMLGELVNLKKPILGICLGMQMLTSYSAEGEQKLLNLIPLQTLDFAESISLKIPHMGWNTVKIEKSCPLFKGIPDNSYFYFVHSYFVEYNSNFTTASCNYGTTFSAALQKDNFFGLQFHPEKSGDLGGRLLKNFSII
ncbi:MAG TPA: imidazole glycerol phosphate synthase subunit HisH [Sphingobacteriaceae bacterium]|nr:imidazole glycerol phosphate synthase subunit HisH [Sphingobacteriaceae bacterium]